MSDYGMVESRVRLRGVACSSSTAQSVRIEYNDNNNNDNKEDF